MKLRSRVLAGVLALVLTVASIPFPAGTVSAEEVLRET